MHDKRDRSDGFEQIAVKDSGHSENKDEQERLWSRKWHGDEIDSTEDTQLRPKERFRTTSYT